MRKAASTRKIRLSPDKAKSAILDAAEDIIVDVGVAGLRLSEVAKKAGMAHPNILHHFGSRENLIASLADRVGERRKTLVSEAIAAALRAPDNKLVDAITHVLDEAFEGNKGKLSIWLHLSKTSGPLEPYFEQIATMAHELHRRFDSNVTREETNRVVMLITLSLCGEAVCGPSVKNALNMEHAHDTPHNFRRWLAELLVTGSLSPSKHR